VLAAVHVHPLLSVGAGVVLGALLVMYWVNLGDPNVPASRRRIRRVSLFLMFGGIFSALCGTSLFDPDVDAERLSYVYSWTLTLGFVILVGLTAFADLFNSLRLHLERQARAAERTAEEVMQQLIRQQARGTSPDERAR